jgi:hypothetical protein
MFVKFHQKMILFIVYVKKDQKYYVKYFIFSIKIYIFYTHHTICRFIMKRLCEHVAHADVRADFLLQFFNILKFIKYIYLK